ncbi:MAG: TetR/AcrR family transcriptional regulator [Spirochaetia bacterium]
MPKETFINLDEGKKTRIRDAAAAEFAARGYKGASVGRIAREAGVAKGSMYQYFENKEALFNYLIDSSMEMKLAFFRSRGTEITGDNFFKRLRSLIILGLEFARLHPDLQQIGESILKKDVLPAAVSERIDAKLKVKSDEIYRTMILSGIEEGDIRKDIDPALAAFAVNSVMKGMGEMIMGERLSDEEIKSLSGSVTDFIRRGIEKEKEKIDD